MSVKLLTEHHLEFISLKGGCRGSSESTLVKMSNCWKSLPRLIFYKFCFSHKTERTSWDHPYWIKIVEGLSKYMYI